MVMRETMKVIQIITIIMILEVKTIMVTKVIPVAVMETGMGTLYSGNNGRFTGFSTQGQRPLMPTAVPFDK
jgi:hypothetical protein